MSEIIPFDSTSGGAMAVPDYVTALLGEDGNIAARMSINALSYKGKTWRRIVDGEETMLTERNGDGDTVPKTIINLVVLDHNKGRSRAFYKGEYVEGANAAPDCYSGDGIKPDENVKEKECTTCAACPNAVKGSKITNNNKATTACSPFKRIAVVPSGKGIASHPEMLLRLAQTSVWDKDNKEEEAKGWYAWDQYLDMLRARGAKHTAAVETRVKFDMRQAYPKLLFTASRWLAPDEVAAAKKRMDDDADTIKTILLGLGNDGVAGTPGISPAGVDPQEPTADTTKVQPAAKPAIDPAVEAAAKAAAKAAREAKEKAAAKAKAKADLAAQMAALDEDDGAPTGVVMSENKDGTMSPAAADDDGFGAAPVETRATVSATKVAKGKATATDAVVKETPAAVTAVEGTPTALKGLLDGWDGDE